MLAMRNQGPREQNHGKRVEVATKIASSNSAEFRKFAHFRLALFEFQRHSEAVLDQFDISIRQFYAMLIIKMKAKKKNITVGAIARGMCIHPSSASGLVARLETAGLAERIFDLDNRRKVRVQLTHDGDSLLAEIIARDSENAGTMRAKSLQVLDSSPIPSTANPLQTQKPRRERRG